MADGNGFTGFEPLRRSISGELFDDGFTRGRYAVSYTHLTLPTKRIV